MLLTRLHIRHPSAILSERSLICVTEMAELSEMIYDRGLRDWELEPAYNAPMEDVDLEKVQAFIAQRSILLCRNML